MQRILCFGRYATASPGVCAVAEVQELDALRAVVDLVLVVERDVDLLQFALGKSLRPIGPRLASSHCFGPFVLSSRAQWSD